MLRAMVGNVPTPKGVCTIRAKRWKSRFPGRSRRITWIRSRFRGSGATECWYSDILVTHGTKHSTAGQSAADEDGRYQSPARSLVALAHLADMMLSVELKPKPAHEIKLGFEEIDVVFLV
jgi:hypothetical protein